MRFSIDQPAHAPSASWERNISPLHKDALLKERQEVSFLTSQENTCTSVTETARLEFHFHCTRNVPTHRALTLRSRHYRLLSRGQLKSILRRASPKEIARLANHNWRTVFRLSQFVAKLKTNVNGNLRNLEYISI